MAASDSKHKGSTQLYGLSSTGSWSVHSKQFYMVDVR